MSLARLRPSAQQALGSGVVHGTTFSYDALSDDDPSTYIEFPGGGLSPLVVTIEEASLPADTKVVGLGLFTTTMSFGGVLQYVLHSETSIIGPPSDPHYLFLNETISWVTPTTTTPLFDSPIKAAPQGLALSIGRADGFITAANLYEVAVAVSYLNRPAVVVGQPQGTISDTNSPDVAWILDFDMPDESSFVPGYGMTAYEAKIFDSATYGDPDFDPATSTPVLQSGIRTDGVTEQSVYGPGSRWSFPDSLPNGDYKAAVRAAQTIDGVYWWSEWDVGPVFTVDPPTPAKPLLVVSADDLSGAIAIDVDAGNLELGAVSTDWIEVQKTVDGGKTWGPVRTTEGYHGVIFPQHRLATVDDLKEAIIGLSPALYWPLDSADGITDISGHGRNGTAAGGISIGLSAALTELADDSSTTFDGTDDKVTSTYAPFVHGTPVTVLGMAQRTNHTTVDPLFSTSTAAVFLGLTSGNQDALFYPDALGHQTTWVNAWPGDGEPVFWAWNFVDVAPFDGLAFFFPNGQALMASPWNAGDFSGGGSGNFQVGGASTNWFGGKLSHVAVFTRGLSSSEIAGLNNLISNSEASFF